MKIKPEQFWGIRRAETYGLGHKSSGVHFAPSAFPGGPYVTSYRKGERAAIDAHRKMEGAGWYAGRKALYELVMMWPEDPSKWPFHRVDGMYWFRNAWSNE